MFGSGSLQTLSFWTYFLEDTLSGNQKFGCCLPIYSAGGLLQAQNRVFFSRQKKRSRRNIFVFLTEPGSDQELWLCFLSSRHLQSDGALQAPWGGAAAREHHAQQVRTPLGGPQLRGARQPRTLRNGSEQSGKQIREEIRDPTESGMDIFEKRARCKRKTRRWVGLVWTTNSRVVLSPSL